MILSEVIKIIEAEYPKSLAYEWDNVGLLAGTPEKEVKRALLTLDITPDTVSEAENFGADLIISHHPLIFSGIKNFSETNAKMKMYSKVIRGNFAVLTAHTNMDTAQNGINERLARLFDFSEPELLDANTGLGRIGNVKKTTLLEFSKEVKKKLGTPFVRICGDPGREILRAAVGSGACAELIPEAIFRGADVFISGDIKYHTALDAVSDGISIIDAGHYPTEIIVTDMFEELLRDTGIILKKSKSKDIFSVI